jgi:hypothetical protein
MFHENEPMHVTLGLSHWVCVSDALHALGAFQGVWAHGSVRVVVRLRVVVARLRVRVRVPQRQRVDYECSTCSRDPPSSPPPSITQSPFAPR